MVTNNEKGHLRHEAADGRLTVGLDLGDRATRYCVMLYRGLSGQPESRDHEDWNKEE